MNWLERLEGIELEITCGDGKKYTPLWTDAKKNIDYNTEGFDSIGIEGTFVDRKKVKGTQYPITLYFQGENHIEITNAFELSARDSRPWTVKHPFYDTLIVQPLNLVIDNSQYNVSKVTGVVWETILNKYPQQSVSVSGTMESKKADFDNSVSAKFGFAMDGSLDPELPSVFAQSVLAAGNAYSKLSEGAQDLKDLLRTASGAAQDAIGDVDAYIRSAINLINFPFQIEQDIQQKVVAMLDTIGEFANIFLGDETFFQKQVSYQSQVGVTLTQAALNLAFVTPEDFQTRADVVLLIERLSDTYDAYLESLDNVGFNADQELSLELDNIINTTIASLFDVAFNSKQERTYVLEVDDNIVKLAHRFYGAGDENLQSFVNQNAVGKNEYLGMKKGREIVYFV